jgi:membrane protease subunit HflC
MKNQLTLLIGIVVVAILLAYMFAFQVRYDEVAVLTTFDKAQEPLRDEQGKLVLSEQGKPADAGSLKFDPGLYLKAPWPIQKVYKYSRKIQILEDRAEELQTADGKAIVLTLYLAWRIDDAHQFFRALESVPNAEKNLEPLLRAVKGVVSQYRFDQLVNTDPAQLKLAQIEQQCAEQLREKLTEIKPGYGIRVEQIGIRRLVLPEQTTPEVFAHMRSTRERLAESARSEGRSQASTIVSNAESARDRILAFASRRAQAIRDEGNREAATYYTAFKADEDFAIFLRQIEALKAMLAHNTTFILDANDLWFLNVLKQERPAAAAPAVAEESAITRTR